MNLSGVHTSVPIPGFVSYPGRERSVRAGAFLMWGVGVFGCRAGAYLLTAAVLAAFSSACCCETFRWTFHAEIKIADELKRKPAQGDEIRASSGSLGSSAGDDAEEMFLRFILIVVIIGLSGEENDADRLEKKKKKERKSKGKNGGSSFNFCQKNSSQAGVLKTSRKLRADLSLSGRDYMGELPEPRRLVSIKNTFAPLAGQFHPPVNSKSEENGDPARAY